MPQQKDLKRLVRERMRRTGETYTTARAHVVRSGTDRRDLAALAGTSDAAVEKKTGRDWRSWTELLDQAGAASKPLREIAKLLVVEHGVNAWWAQTVTVGYERIRGLRDKGQRRGGGYDVNKSKTLPVPVATLYAAFGARKRARWMGPVELRVKTAAKEKSMRIAWGDGTSVDVYFASKGAEKSTVTLQHRGLPDRKTADRVRTEWTARLEELARQLAG